MPKVYKTKKQKQLADIRRVSYSLSDISVPHQTMDTEIKTLPVEQYAYVLQDLKKTIALIISIILIQILLYYIIHTW